jgi:hypothetical protein
MGILDTVLRPHLKALTKLYKVAAANKMLMNELIKSQKINSEQNAKSKRPGLDIESKKFCKRGDAFFKADDFNLALHMYTKSIAAAIEGTLASLAYFKRFL